MIPLKYDGLSQTQRNELSDVYKFLTKLQEFSIKVNWHLMQYMFGEQRGQHHSDLLAHYDRDIMNWAMLWRTSCSMIHSMHTVNKEI